jgi:sulfate transport system substrate-binding protein
MKTHSILLVSALALLAALPASAKSVALLNVSYDPTRELYQDYNQVFAAYWKAKTGDDVTISQSHGGSGKQARAILDGLGADVATLGIESDIAALVKGHLVSADWEKALPNHATPYTSTVVFLVRKGNPKNIKDWSDLTRASVEVVTPNPKTSSGGRWNFLAAYGQALGASHDDAAAKDYVKKLYGNVKVLDSGARGSTVTFVERGEGDVLLAWENEALLTINKLKPGEFEIVYPSKTILAEPPVALVDSNVDKHGTRDVATAYLQHLYSPEGQDVVARNYYRPRDPAAAAKYASQFPKLDLFTEEDVFGNWSTVQKDFFADGGYFDQIYKTPATASK